MTSLLEKYGYQPDKEAIGRSLDIIANALDKDVPVKVLTDCFSFMDLTSLSTVDTPEKIEKFTQKVNDFAKEYPNYPLPASLCVYSNFAGLVRKTLESKDVNVTVVAACFPTSQSFLEVKLKEVEMAMENGADEIDIVLALNKFLSEDKAGAADEIRAVRQCIDNAQNKSGKKIILKVIIEAGLLVSLENIAEASFMAMENGADFIKTSTGKVDVNATPTSAYVMCECIKKYMESTGKMVGFKPAGGISTTMDALCYYNIVSSVLGKQWLTKDFFRLGVSRLANSLLSSIEQKTVSFF